MVNLRITVEIDGQPRANLLLGPCDQRICNAVATDILMVVDHAEKLIAAGHDHGRIARHIQWRPAIAYRSIHESQTDADVAAGRRRPESLVRNAPENQGEQDENPQKPVESAATAPPVKLDPPY